MIGKITAEDLLTACNGLGDDILTEAENAKPRMGTRKRIGLWAAAAAILLLLCALPIFLSYQRHIRLFAPGGGEEAGGMAAMYADILYYDGMYYTYLGTYPGRYRDRPLGTVERNLRMKRKDDPYDPASGVAAATFVPVGARLWSADGWDERLFVCAESEKWGSVDVYTRGYRQSTEDPETSFPVLPEGEKLERAVLSGCGDGVITDASALSHIAEVLETAFVPYESKIPPLWDGGRTLSVTLYYGTPFGVTIRLYEKPAADGTMLAVWLGNSAMTVPADFFDRLYGYTVYRGNNETLSYGGTSAYRDPVCFVPEFEDDRAYQAYVSVAFRVVDGTLYGCSAYDGMETSALVPLAENVKGFVRAEYENVYYLRADGAAAYLRFSYPYAEIPDFSERVRSGEDMRAYITEEGVLYPGPYERMQVRDGVVWGLSADGGLYRNCELYASGVLCFAVDPDGVSYGTDAGLFRDSSVNGKSCLWKGRVSGVVSGGYTLYFGCDRELRRICVDGSASERIAKLSVRSMIPPKDGYGPVLMTGVDTDGRGWVVYEIDQAYYLFRIPGQADSVEHYGSVFCVRYGDETRYDDIYLSGEKYTTAEYYRGGYSSGTEPEILTAEH